MSKQITFTFDDKDYTLEFTKGTVRTMERRGFVADDIDTKPMTVIPDLFAGAFLANHSNVKREKIDKIYEKLNGKQRLVRALVEMYNETLEFLVDDGDSGEENWTPNFEISND